MTQPSWVALRGMAHSFIELDKAVAHVISLISLIRQDEKEMTKDEMVKSYHLLNGHELEQAPGDSGGQGKPGVLQFMRLQRVGYDLATEQQQ